MIPHHTHCCQCLVDSHLSIAKLPFQLGFWPHHSTDISLLHNADNWCLTFDWGLLVGVLYYLDVANTSDTADHCLIIKRLSTMHVNPQAVNWIQSCIPAPKLSLWVILYLPIRIVLWGCSAGISIYHVSNVLTVSVLWDTSWVTPTNLGSWWLLTWCNANSTNISLYTVVVYAMLILSHALPSGS